MLHVSTLGFIGNGCVSEGIIDSTKSHIHYEIAFTTDQWTEYQSKKLKSLLENMCESYPLLFQGVVKRAESGSAEGDITALPCWKRTSSGRSG